MRKSYGRQEAVRDVTFDVEEGRMLALLGPNGAGKSTILNILCTSVRPDGGSVIMDGLQLGRRDLKIRKRIGVVFQNGVLDDPLTVEENLRSRGWLYGLRGRQLQERAEQTARMTGIESLLQRPYGRLSGGQKRRCDIARALIHFPKILFLDEPTTGLDPEMRACVWDAIDAIRRQMNTTVFLTSHYMEEAARADRIVIMKEGKIAAQGTPGALKETLSGDRLLLFSRWPDSLISILAREGVQCVRRGDGVEIPLMGTLAALPLLELCSGRYSGFEVKRATMEQVYRSVIEGGVGHD